MIKILSGFFLIWLVTAILVRERRRRKNKIPLTPREVLFFYNPVCLYLFIIIRIIYRNG